MSLNSIKEYDGSDREVTIPWLDHIKLVAKKMGKDPLEVGISKLQGTALGDINARHKEGNVTWYKVRQRLIEYYLNMPYTSDSMFAYSHLSQGEDEMTAQYLVRAKVLLECIHHTTNLADITGSSRDNLYLVYRLKGPHIRKRVAKEQDSWRMVDIFQSINCTTKTEEKTKAYSKLNFESVP